MGYKKYSDEEIEKAASVDLVEFLKSQGEELKKEGRAYAWLDKGQKVSVHDNLWYHQYERVGGNAISFVRRYFNKTFSEAVDFLLDGKGGEFIYNSKAEPKPKKPFVMPPKDDNMVEIKNYLTAARGIHPSVLEDFIHAGLIYQTTNKGYKNVVFVGLDENDVPRHVALRGTVGNFKGSPESAIEDYSFHWNGTSDEVFLFEAPIDMLSYICLHDKEWQEHTYIAACCVGDRPLMKALQLNSDLQKIHLCMDNDEAGQNANNRILAKFKNNPYYKCDVLVPECKDWNEDLICFQEEEAQGWNQQM